MDNGHEPATKADLRIVEQGVNERIDMLRSEMHHVFDDLKESMRDSQTEFLNAFYGFTQSTDLKISNGESNDANLKERLGVVERRLTELERKVNFPNQPM
jgi:hypothetical protein